MNQKFFLFVIVLLGTGIFLYSQKIFIPNISNTFLKNGEHIEENTSVINNPDTVPFRFLPKKEQYKKAKKHHIYGDFTLKIVDPLFYKYEDFEKGIEIQERCPGILSYIDKDNVKLMFFDESKTLKKEIDIFEENPYLKRGYKKLNLGFPDLEYYKFASESEVEDLLSAEITNYFTLSLIDVNPNGSVIVSHQLIRTSELKIVDSEEVLVIYNREGKKINEFLIKNDVQDSWVSSDEKYLVLMYGGTNGINPQDYYQGGVRVLDLSTKELIYEIKRNPGENYIGLFEVDDSLLDLSIMISEKERVEKEIIDTKIFMDLKTRNLFKKSFSSMMEINELISELESNRYSEVLEKLSFEINKF